MLDIIALILVIIGGINWGSIGIFQFDLVAWLFGGQAAIVSRIIYTLVGIAALRKHRLPPGKSGNWRCFFSFSWLLQKAADTWCWTGGKHFADAPPLPGLLSGLSGTHWFFPPES